MTSKTILHMSIDDAKFLTDVYRRRQEGSGRCCSNNNEKLQKKLLFIYAQIKLQQQTRTHTHTYNTEKLSIILYLIDVS